MKHRYLGLWILPIVALWSPALAADDLHAHSSPNAANAPFDVQFLDTMSQHHRDGIKMMDVALDKAESAAVKDKAEMMRDAQEKEIGELKSMRDDNSPEAVNMKLPGMKPMSTAKLETLSGHAFDHAFMDMTIQHHESAIEMARAAMKSGKDADVREKAEEILDKQSKEMAELKQLRESLKD